MKAIEQSRRAVREALAEEGWRFSCVSSVKEFIEHINACRTMNLPAGEESDNRIRTIREQLLRQIPWELRRQLASRWLSYISIAARQRLQHHLPIAAEFCLTHGFIFLVGDVWAERTRRRWRLPRTDGPAVLIR